MPSFNFLDGSGPVLAHRHKNPDGSLGGWVADTAFVDVGVHVDRTLWFMDRLRYGIMRFYPAKQGCLVKP
jgi:hypothetical protein